MQLMERSILVAIDSESSDFGIWEGVSLFFNCNLLFVVS